MEMCRAQPWSQNVDCDQGTAGICNHYCIIGPAFVQRQDTNPFLHSLSGINCMVAVMCHQLVLQPHCYSFINGVVSMFSDRMSNRYSENA